jgi:hypothetical protein
LTRARWHDGDHPEHLPELSRHVICEYPFNHFVSMFITFDLIKIIFIHADSIWIKMHCYAGTLLMNHVNIIYFCCRSSPYISAISLTKPTLGLFFGWKPICYSCFNLGQTATNVFLDHACSWRCGLFPFFAQGISSGESL